MGEKRIGYIHIAGFLWYVSIVESNGKFYLYTRSGNKQGVLTRASFSTADDAEEYYVSHQLPLIQGA
jgi:hypothetical protein